MSIIKFSKKHKIKEDRFIQTLFEIRQKLGTYRKQFIVGGVSVLLALLIVLLVLHIRSRTNDEANALFGKALLAYQQGRFDEATDRFRQVTQNYSGSHAAPRAAFLTGSIYYENGNYPLAAEAFKKYLEKYSGGDFLNAAVYKSLGATYMQLKDYAKAIDALSEAIAKYPSDFDVPDMRYKLALCHLETRDNLKARSELERIVSLFPKSAQAKNAVLLLASL